MELFSYIVTHDTGFSPNPFFGVCTLACCKPDIRRTAQEGDWVVGLTPRVKGRGNRLVYYMVVQKSIEFDQYWQQFPEKRQNPEGGPKERNGDNIYFKDGDEFRQDPSAHVHNSAEEQQTDLRGKRVLIAKRFVYFGSEAKELPPTLKKALTVGRKHRHLAEKVAKAFQRYVERHKAEWGVGVQAPPRRWPEGDKTWRTVGCGCE